jgi:hypothetical protein
MSKYPTYGNPRKCPNEKTAKSQKDIYSVNNSHFESLSLFEFFRSLLLVLQLLPGECVVAAAADINTTAVTPPPPDTAADTAAAASVAFSKVGFRYQFLNDTN